MCSGFKRGGVSVETTPGLQLNHLFNNGGSCLSHTIHAQIFEYIQIVTSYNSVTR